MFIVTAKVPKRRYVLLGVLVVLLLLLSAAFLKKGGTEAPEPETAPRVETNAQRVAYLASLGWEADSEPVEALRMTLPDELVEPYRSYNELQLRQGFDLTPLLGETLERYTYTVTNYPGRPRGCQADLYVCDGTVVAGDVICTGADGFIATLEYPG
ncbi:MAG: DUF4830 domain-containing protein [Ruminococcaceae bacterium]|nr:DUF4830 domain-containing protein [Oscillospiraceae bacterium]